ncbi:MAG: PEP-CTERM sorting domain-containing protein [Gemmatimonadaceae bacterium]
MKRFSFTTTLMLLGFGAQPAHAQLISNGGFETGVLSPWVTTIPCAAAGAVNVFNAPSGIAHSGSFGLRISSPTTCSAVQSVATTSGLTYTLSFWLANTLGSSTNQFTAYVGQGIATVSFGNALPFAYALQTTDFIATSASTLIRFDGQNSNSDAAWYVDDVSVVLRSNMTPEPTSIILMALGLFAVAGARFVRREVRSF